MKKFLLACSCTLLLAGALISLGSCTGNGPDQESANQGDTGQVAVAAPGTTAKTVLPETGLKITYLQHDSLILATVNAKSIPDTMHFKLEHAYQQLHIQIKEIKADSLTGALWPEGIQRNIRFNQIIMPDGTMDGPFGHEIRYKTSQQGNYTLILGKDNMADGRVEGAVAVHIALK